MFTTLSLLSAAAVVKGQEQSIFANDTTVETPVCQDGEELFRLQLLNDGYNFAPSSYRIFTESTDELHEECVQCMTYSPGADVQLCLPRDQCHTAVVGRGMGRWVSCSQRSTEELVATWGGEVIRRNNAYLFDRVDFGDGCRVRALH